MQADKTPAIIETKNIGENEYPILADGNCFFYSVVLGFLLPALGEFKLFSERIAILSNNTFSDADKMAMQDLCSKYLSARGDDKVYMIFGAFSSSSQRHLSLMGRLVNEIKLKINYCAAWAGEPEFQALVHHFPINLAVHFPDSTQREYCVKANNTKVVIRSCTPVSQEADLQGHDALMQSAIIESQVTNRAEGKASGSHFRLMDNERKIFLAHVNLSLTQTLAATLLFMTVSQNMASAPNTNHQQIIRPQRSYDFIDDSSTTSAHDPSSLETLKARVKKYLIIYPHASSKSYMVSELIKYIDSVNFRDNSLSSLVSYDSDTIKLRFATLMRESLDITIPLENFSEVEEFHLFCLYVELMLEYGWHNHLAILEQYIKDHITKKTFKNYHHILEIFIKMIAIAHIMIQHRFPRHELKLIVRLLQDDEQHEQFQRTLYHFAFKLIINAKTIKSRHTPKNLLPTHPPDNPSFFSDAFCECVGKSYLQFLGKSKVEHWDLVNFYVIFFELIHFERENTSEITELLQVFETVDFSTQQALRRELVKNRSLKFLVNKMLDTTFFVRSLGDLTLLYGEIFFSGGKNTTWADSCNNVGYLIVRYDENWVSLYNTKTGYMSDLTGILFDAALLESTESCLRFKVLKRDGWHLFTTAEGLDPQSWDNITLLSSGYLYCIKDKLAHLLCTKTNKVLKSFSNVRSMQCIRHTPTLDIAIKSDKFWIFFDVQHNRALQNIPNNIVSLDWVPFSETHLVLYDNDKNCFLYNANLQRYIHLKDAKKIHYESSGDVFVENNDGVFCIIRNLQTVSRVSEIYFKRMSKFHSGTRNPVYGLQSMGVFNLSDSSPVRYDYQIELQGRYHITQDGGKSVLWLHNTVGGGRGVLLVKNADEIQLLGVSRKIASNIKAYFLIKNGPLLNLYTSYYTMLKLLSDLSEEVESPPHHISDIHGKKIIYLYDIYFSVFISNQWVVYEEGYGSHQPVKAEEIQPLDFKNFLKVKIEGKWHLYDLSSRTVLSTKGANEIKMTAENKIVLVCDEYIRYMSYQALPSCERFLDLESVKKEMSSDPTPLQDNYVANAVKQSDFPWRTNHTNSQVFLNTLLRFVDYSFLKALTSEFINKLAELFDGKHIEVNDIRDDITIINQRLVYCLEASFDASINLTALMEEIKKSIRSLTKKLKEKMEIIYNSFNVRGEVIIALSALPPLQVNELATALKIRHKDIADALTQEQKKLSQNFTRIISRLVTKQTDGANIVQLLNTHPHIMPGILRYWFNIDPQGIIIDALYHGLVALTNLFIRLKDYDQKNREKLGYIIIQKHYFGLFKLYRFPEVIINNIIMAEYDLDAIQDLLALLDNLQGTPRELAIINKALEIGPTMNSCFEKVDAQREREIERSRIDNITNLLRLMAIANELKSESIYSLDLNQFTKSPNALEEFIKQLAHLLRTEFYLKLGISVDRTNNHFFDDQYLIDIMYSYENLKDENKILLILLLKSILYSHPFIPLVTLNSSDELLTVYSNTEKILLSKLVAHNNHVRESFIANGIHWDIWQQGLGSLQGKNVTISLWKRNVAHDIFQGEFCNSCISLHKDNAKANLQYISDLNFSMIEIIDNKSGNTIGHVTLWIAKSSSQRTILVLNSIQINRRFHHHSKEIWSLVLKYADDFSKKLGVQKVVLGQCYNVNPPRILYEFDDAGQIESKSRKKTKTKIDRKFCLTIIAPTLFSEFYSDAYFDGQVETSNMENERCQAWDLTTLMSHAKTLQDTYPEIPVDARLKNIDIWIIENGLLNGILVCGKYHLILIDKQYIEKDPTAALSKIVELFNTSATLPDEQLIDQSSSTKNTLSSHL